MAPRSRPSDGSSSVILPVQLRSFEPHADPIPVRGGRPFLSQQEIPGLVGEPVPTRAGSQVDEPMGRIGRREIDVGKGPARPTELESLAGPQRLRAESGQRVGRTAAEGPGDLDPTADGQIVAQADRRRLNGQSITGPQREGAVRRRRRGVDQQLGRRSGDGHPAQRLHRDHQTAEGRFDGRGVLTVADQPVGEVVCGAVGGTRRRDAQMGQAGPPEILHGRQRTGLLDDDHDRPDGAKRICMPGCRRAGGSRSRSHNGASVRPISCQPPGPDLG